MKKDLLITAVSALLVVSPTQAKSGARVKLTYDSNGNVTSRSLASTTRSVFVEEKDPMTTVQDRITVGPNPTDGIFSVERQFGSEDQLFTYSLYGLNSQLIESRQTTDRFVQFDLSGHADGIYILQVIGPDYKNSWKIIKR